MFKVVGILIATLLIAVLFGGYFFLRRQHAPADRARVEQARQQDDAPISLHVYENEVYLRNSEAIIGGTIQNASPASLSRLAVTIKLTARGDRREETRRIELTPETLAPGERAAYKLAVPSSVWSGAQVENVVAEESPTLAFRRFTGEPRPRENPPASRVRTIVVEERPKPKPKGEEFINTPDTPVVIR